MVGSVEGLGKGERIFAVRFIGEMAYVVTFRQVDPLYAIDLSDAGLKGSDLTSLTETSWTRFPSRPTPYLY